MPIRTFALAIPLAMSPVLWAAPPPFQEGDAPNDVLWRELERAPSRPWLGVSLAGTGNLEITEVQAGSPAAAAGLRPGDRILSLDQEQLEDFAALTEALSGHQAGDEVRLVVARPVTVAFSEDHRAEDGRPLLGVYLDGNQVTGVQEGHPAAAAELQEGDRILAIDGTPTSSFDGIIERLRASQGGSVDLLVGRRVRLELGSRPGESATPTPGPFPGPQGFQWRLPRGEAPFPEAGGLRQELRSLVEEIAQLRAEIADLRAQIDALHGAHGAGGAREAGGAR